MERQLVKHGTSTLMVSLPRDWLKTQHLEKGDSVEVIPKEGKVLISPRNRKSTPRKTSLSFSHPDYDLIRNKLSSLYREGCEEIIISFRDPSCFYHIQRMINLFPGFEIIEHSEKGCILRNITKEISLDTEQILNKLSNIIKTEFSIAREYLSKGVKGKKEEFQTLRDEGSKLRNLVYVYLKENLLSSAFHFYFLIHILEHNASFLYWLYRSFDQSSIAKVSPDFLKLYDRVSEYFTNSLLKLKRKDEDYISYIMDTRRNLLKECEHYALTTAKDRFLIIYLAMLIQNIHNPKSMIA